ncbi:PRM10 [Candida oxycetoniae]|uniref:Pheromone-regulated membrane protein 10 n=1 Tax=Candida oxycetoniae TaxID=497107 RepID=A0AAI9WZP2_9ASCO|nr:PRM10 [Candida oxycetoniae]KAI3406577.2 PRM10 [Candida oxycetoniae]
MSNEYSSSSDEESFRDSQHRFRIQLPQHYLDLNKARKHKRDNIKLNKATSNFAKVTKLNPKKNARFADSYTPKDLRFSMGSSRASDTEDDSDDTDEFTPGKQSMGVEILPHFTFDQENIKKNQQSMQDSSDESDEISNEDDGDDNDNDNRKNTDFQTHTHPNRLPPPPEQVYQTDSSDDESAKNEQYDDDDDHHHHHHGQHHHNPQPRFSSSPSSERNTFPRRKSKESSSSLHDETFPSLNSRKSNETSESKKNDKESSSGGIKGILRKMSLVDRFPSDDIHQDIGHSDTFLGRVFNIGHGGISGGGLTPGASRASDASLEAIDEEKKVGFAESENDRDAIEMKPIANFEDLSEEAKQLIRQHLPGHVLDTVSTNSGTTSTTTTTNNNNNNNNNGTNITPSGSSFEKLLDDEKGNKKSTSDDNGNSDNDNDDDDEKKRKSKERKKRQNLFYAPNPDIYLRGEKNEGIYNDEEGNYWKDLEGEYVARPKQVQAGVLSSLLKLYQNPQETKSASSLTTSDSHTLHSDENSYEEDNKRATSHLDITKLKSGIKSGLKFGKKSIEAGVNSGVVDAPNVSKKIFHKAASKLKSNEYANKGIDKPLPKVDDSDIDDDDNSDARDSTKPDIHSHLPSFQNAKPKMPKKMENAGGKMKKKLRNKQRAERLRITVHIADILQSQRFIMNMCRALMLFGAPTHRLEEYLIMTSRVLEIDGQFMYFPGCMLVSFGDAATRTSEVHLVRCAQGLNLGKLTDMHRIYKAVIHDLIGVEEASKKLDDLLKSPNRYSPWMCVLFYGLGSLAVTPFAFQGGWIDLPISFGLGLCVGYLQFFLSSKSNLYSNVFEVSAAIVVAFVSRGIGSIRSGNLFCFSAITQGALALILPGYIILCGSLELQSRNLVAGSVRMFYAIIYSLFLGFGITLGAALYGWVDHNATSQNSCLPGHTVNDKFRIIFVPLFAVMLALINQAKWRQLPVMIVITAASYVATYFAGKHFSTVTEFTSCIGAFIIGVLGNLYSRVWKGMAVSAMLPAIFVQVPSGIASKGSLISGLQQADKINNRNGTTTEVENNTSSLSFGATMVEVSIGISVGLFAAALVVYPFGKKRTGLSSSSTPDSDQLRIYSLLAYNTTLSSDEEWNTVDFQGTKCIISRLVLNNHVDETSPSDKQGINITGESEGSNVESLIKTGKEEDEVVSEPIVFYVVLFYDTGGESENKQDEDENGDSNHEVKEGKDKYLADAIAKVKVDCIVDALREGLNGYGEKH